MNRSLLTVIMALVNACSHDTGRMALDHALAQHDRLLRWGTMGTPVAAPSQRTIISRYEILESNDCLEHQAQICERIVRICYIKADLLEERCLVDTQLWQLQNDQHWRLASSPPKLQPSFRRAKTDSTPE